MFVGVEMCLKFKFLCNCHFGPKYDVGTMLGTNVGTTLGTNVNTTFRQYCVNFVASLPECCPNVGQQRCGPTLPQHSHNVAWTLSQHHQRWGPTLPQCSHNVVWTLSQCWSPTLGDQDCLNVVSTSVTNIGNQRCHNIHATLPQFWYSVSQRIACEHVCTIIVFDQILNWDMFLCRRVPVSRGLARLPWWVYLCPDKSWRHLASGMGQVCIIQCHHAHYLWPSQVWLYYK